MFGSQTEMRVLMGDVKWRLRNHELRPRALAVFVQIRRIKEGDYYVDHFHCTAVRLRPKHSPGSSCVSIRSPTDIITRGASIASLSPD